MVATNNKKGGTLLSLGDFIIFTGDQICPFIVTLPIALTLGFNFNRFLFSASVVVMRRRRWPCNTCRMECTGLFLKFLLEIPSQTSSEVLLAVLVIRVLEFGTLPWHPVIMVKFGTCKQNWDFFGTKIWDFIRLLSQSIPDRQRCSEASTQPKHSNMEISFGKANTQWQTQLD